MHCYVILYTIDDFRVKDVKGTWCSWLSRSLSMREVLGSIPNVSTCSFAFAFYGCRLHLF